MNIEDIGSISVAEAFSANQARGVMFSLQKFLAEKNTGYEKSIPLTDDGIWIAFVVSGILTGSPIVFLNQDGKESAFICLLSHLKLSEDTFNHIKVSLRESYTNRSLLSANMSEIELSNPALHLIGFRGDKVDQDILETAFKAAQSNLDHLYRADASMIFTSPSLVLEDYINKEAVGFGFTKGKVFELPQGKVHVPAAITKKVTVSASSSLKEERTEIEEKYLNSIHWRRQAKLSSKFIEKILYYWISFESCVGKYKKTDIKERVGVIFGYNLDKVNNILGEETSEKVVYLHRKVKAENSNNWSHFVNYTSNLRANIVHVGSMETLIGKAGSDIDFVKASAALNTLSSIVIPRCLSFLEFMLNENSEVGELERAWSEYSLPYSIRKKNMEDMYFQKKVFEFEGLSDSSIYRHAI